MVKYIRVYSDAFSGQIFTVQAFDILKEQLCNGNPAFYETSEITEAEIAKDEKIHDISDLEALGFAVPLTEQSDEVFFENIEDLSENDDEGYEEFDEQYESLDDDNYGDDEGYF